MFGFQRDISFKFDRTENGDILVTNCLHDSFHDIVMQVFVDYESLSIKNIKVDLNKTPTMNCIKIKSKLDLLKGITISKGMTRKIIQVLGGCEGCINIRNMLLSSLPLVLNVKYGSGKKDEEESLEAIQERLLGTCIGYSDSVANQI